MARLLKVAGISAALLMFVFALAFFAAEHLFYLGRNEFFASNAQKAKKLLAFPAILYPANEMYFYYNLAAQIKTSGNPAGLENEIKTIPQKFSNQSQAYFRQARLYFMLAEYSGNKKYLQNVSLSLKESVKLNPFSVENLYAQAGFELLMGNLNAALIAINRNINISPNNPYSWIMLAEIKKAQQDKAGTLEALSRASSLWPENVFLKKVLSQAKISKKLEDIWLPVDWPRVENFDL